MTESQMQERRQYVQAVRDSFRDVSTNVSHPKPDTYEPEEEQTVGGSVFFKVKLFLAVVLFAAFVLGDRTDTRLFSLTTDDLTDKICENQISFDSFDSFRHLLVEK